MSTNDTTPVIHIGIDIAKDTLQLDPTHLRGLAKVDNNPQGLKTLIRKLTHLRTRHPRLHIICEATGGYERRLLDALHAAQIPVSLVHPLHVHSFAKASKRLAKTDAIDAALLTLFGQRMEPRPTPPPSDLQRELAALVTRRNQLQEMQTREKNRLGLVDDALVRESITDSIEHFESLIERLDARLKALVASDTELAGKVERLSGIKGVGEVTATALLAIIPELGTLTGSQTAALAGLAPRNRDSGSYQGKRTIGGGRKAARKALYMAAVAATRWNPRLREFYLRLRAKGKPGKLALTAVMRQLLVVMNSVLKKRDLAVA